MPDDNYNSTSHKIKTYLYDQMGRVRDEYIHGADYSLETTYEYDLMGNISEKWYSGPNSNQTDTTTYSYDLNNRLLSESTDTYYYKTDKTHSYSSIRYYYDNNGNMTAKQGTNTSRGGMSLSGHSADMGMSIYRYDAFNRLTQYYSSSAEASYTYNANNLRASKTVNREKIDFVWNGQNLAAENKADSVNTYTYDITGVHIANQNGNITSYLKDYHGNIVGTTTVAGTMVQEETNRMDYDAFGNQWIGDTPDPFGYCGEYYDYESGLIYLRNRYYNSSTGRFINEDPIKDGLNWYAYAGNNPVNAFDPSGLKTEGELIQIGTGSIDDVKAIQNKLNSLGYTGKDGKKLSVDGVFGTNTDYAVRQYQKNNGLSIDGIVGDATWSSMGFQMASSLPKTGTPNSQETLYDQDGNKSRQENMEKMVKQRKTLIINMEGIIHFRMSIFGVMGKGGPHSR